MNPPPPTVFEILALAFPSRAAAQAEAEMFCVRMARLRTVLHDATRVQMAEAFLSAAIIETTAASLIAAVEHAPRSITLAQRGDALHMVDWSVRMLEQYVLTAQHVLRHVPSAVPAEMADHVARLDVATLAALRDRHRARLEALTS